MSLKEDGKSDIGLYCAKLSGDLDISLKERILEENLSISTSKVTISFFIFVSNKSLDNISKSNTSFGSIS